MLRPETLPAALAGVEVVYYLVHSLGGQDFETTDRRAATNLAAAVAPPEYAGSSTSAVPRQRPSRSPGVPGSRRPGVPGSRRTCVPGRRWRRSCSAPECPPWCYARR